MTAITITIQVRAFSSVAQATRGLKIFAEMHNGKKITQVFPGDPDPQLARMFVLELDPRDNVEARLQELRALDFIDAAYRAPRRRVMREPLW